MEMSVCQKTEDVYQILHQPPVVRNTKSVNGSVKASRFSTVLLVFNTLLLVLILAAVVLMALFSRPVLEEKKGAWLLYKNSFYSILEAEGNCSVAKFNCHSKGFSIRLAVLTSDNKDWLITQAKGRRLLVAKDESLSGCKLVGDPVHLETPFSPGEEQGWVCEHQQDPWISECPCLA